MLTTEEYEEACEELCRYGYNYDRDVDEHIPIEMDRMVADMSRKRPKYLTKPRKKTYYQAQCSFRGLASTGTVIELQQRLEYRDIDHDLEVEEYFSELQQEVNVYLAAQKARDAELWWRDPDRMLTEKAAVDAFRAVQEDLANGGRLATSCEQFQLDDNRELERVARDDFNLAFEVVKFGYATFQVVGQAEAVNAEAQSLRQRAQAWRHEGEVEDRRAKQETRAKNRAILEDAMEDPDDWDLTGKWVVDCKELAEFVYEPPYFQKTKLTMEIWEEKSITLTPISNPSANTTSRNSISASSAASCAFGLATPLAIPPSKTTLTSTASGAVEKSVRTNPIRSE